MRTKSRLSNCPIRITVILVVVIPLSGALYSQSFLSGLGLEAGGGHNQLFWSAQTRYFPPNTNTTITYDRTDLSFTPTVRVNYRWDIARAIQITPFAGYNQFGGKKRLANDYEDQYWFDALEGGTSCMYSVNDLSFGLGVKANYHLKVTGRYFGSAIQTTSANASWDVEDVTSWFTKWSADAGVRISLRHDHFSLGLEGWFGITKLGAGLFSAATIRENQYRILLGYTL
jgi:hypothetical protein